MFYIRADGNETIGMGHIARCMTIAEALQAAGEEVCFLIADEKPVKVLEERGFRYEILFTYYDEMDVELPQLVLKLGTAAGSGKVRILIDSYYVTEFYIKNLMLQAEVILLDDNADRVLPCHTLVNYNIYAESLGYAEKYPDSRLVLGATYAPIRSSFAGAPAEIRDEMKHVLVTCGGSDGCHMELALTEAVKNEMLPQNLVYHLVVGPFSEDGDRLEEETQGDERFCVHRGVSDLSDLMRTCDAAVSAAGSTLYELCAVGLPTIGFTMASNQHRNMEAFAKLTPIMNAGDFSIAPDAALAFIAKELTLLAGEPQLRQKISAAMRSLVDGQGAKHLAEELLKQ